MPFCYQDWWLDAVCGPRAWDVAISSAKDGKPVAAMAYGIGEKLGLRLLRPPILTPYLGPVLLYPKNQQRSSSQYAFEKSKLTDLIDQLPKYSYFHQSCHYDFTNALPFEWKGFETSVGYHYILALKSSVEELFRNFEGSVRTDIKRAETSGLTIDAEVDIDSFYELNSKSFTSKGNTVPYPKDLLRRIDAALDSRDMRTIYGARDPEGYLHAAVYLIHEQEKLYTLMIGSDPALRKSGAVQFLIGNIVKTYQESHQSLDFCGSSIESIERVFRSFGSQQTSYIKLKHIPNRLLRGLWSIKA